jgi:urea-proton symporter
MQALGLTLLIFVAWPLLTLPAGIFSRDYFRFWIVLAMIWGTLAGVHAPAGRSPAYH